MVELMIALAIVAFGIAAAAKISSSAVRSSRRGTEAVDISQHARLVSRQLRVDLRLAGAGTTGAIGVEGSGGANWSNFWSYFATGYSSGGQTMMPAVVGEDNIAAGTTIVSAAVGTTPNWVTDAIQLVVPDPTTRTQTSLAYDAGTSGSMSTYASVNQCPSRLVLIVDHSAANGAGKSQIAVQTSGNCSNCVSLADHTIFAVSAGSDVMCARISTYLIAIPGNGATTIPWLMRSDLDPTHTPSAIANGTGTVYVDGAGSSNSWLDAPGVYDLQIAYAFSSELAGRTAAPAARWAFTCSTCGAMGTAPSGAGWFETREVRFNMLLANVRTLKETGQNIAEVAAENGGTIALPAELGRFRLTAGEVLTSLRFFDKALPQGVAPTPF